MGGQHAADDGQAKVRLLSQLWLAVCHRRDSSSHSNKPSTPFSVHSCIIDPLSQHGKSSCSAAGSSQTGLPSMPQTAIALISWEARLDVFWPADWQPCGPWFVLYATLPPFREHLAHLLLNTHSLVSAKLPPLPNQVNAGGPWPQPEMLRQSESLSRLCEK